MVTEIADARKANFVLLKGIENTKLEQLKSVINAGAHPEFEELLKNNTKLKELYEGNWQGYSFKSRSEAEESLITLLCRNGFSDGKIKKIMQGCKIGKWQEKDDSYKNLTIEKGRKFAEKCVKREEEYRNIKLADICADLIHKRVKVDVIVIGEQDKKAIDRVFEIKCNNCGKRITIDTLENESPEILQGLLFKGIDRFLEKLFIQKHGEKCSREEDGRHKFEVKTEKYMDYAVLLIREIRTTSEKFNAKIYKQRKAFLIKQPLPTEKKIRLYGWLIIEPKTKDICILATRVEILEDQLNTFEITEEDKENWNKHFKNTNTESIANHIAPHIVGDARLIAKEGECLCLHSPSEIPTPDGDIIRGGLRILNFGDTKVGKSELGKGITGYGNGAYSFGEYIVGESAKRCGITYTIDTDVKAIIWGVLATNDLGLVVIDGLQSIFSDEIGELREALEQQKIIVRRSQSGEAFARTRVIGCMNPHEEMSNYIYPAQALQSSYPFNNPPDVTRWDIFIPFSLDDVPFNEITCEKTTKRTIPDEVFTRHVYWAWTRKPDQIEYTDKAKDKIREESAKIMNEYNLASLPIVHPGFLNVLCRFSVTFAVIMHSTDEQHEKIIVENTHVEKAIKFYEKALEMLELKEFKEDNEGNTTLQGDEFKNICAELDDREFKILELIKLKEKPSTEIATELGVSDRTVKEHYKKLKRFKLIKAKQGKGISITQKGIRFLKRFKNNGVIEINSEIVKKHFTNREDSEANLHYFTNTFLPKWLNSNCENVGEGVCEGCGVQKYDLWIIKIGDTNGGFCVECIKDGIEQELKKLEDVEKDVAKQEKVGKPNKEKPTKIVNLNDLNEDGNITKKKYKCVCGAVFGTVEELRRHQANCAEFQDKQNKDAQEGLEG